MTGRLLPLLVVLLVIASPLALASNGGGPNTETVNGHVYDEHGMAARGVLVHVEGTSHGVPTDENGCFNLTGNDLDGSHAILFSKEGYMTARKDYHLTDGKVMTMSIYMVEMEEAPGSVVGIVEAFDGSPMESSLVILEGEGGSKRTTLTDASGRFEFTEVPFSTSAYTISAEAVGHTTTTQDVFVVPDAVTRIELILIPETPMELVRGQVTDARGLPLPGAMIAIEGSQVSWTTDLDGNFSALVEGRMGQRDLMVSLRGYQTSTYGVTIPDPGVATVRLVLESDGTGGPETLWVHVSNARTGEPIDDSVVTLEDIEGTWTTDSEGLVVMTGDDLEGRQTIVASKESYTTSAYVYDLEDGGSGAVRLQITRTSNAVTLDGTVVDASTDRPVLGAVVTVNAEGIVWLVHSGEDGGFLIHNLPPGVTTHVVATAPGYDVLVVETVLEEYTANYLLLEMEKDRPAHTTLSGTVIDDGGPVEGTKVTLWKDDFNVVTRTDADGGFLVLEVPVDGGPLSYRVEDQYHVQATGQLATPPDKGMLYLDVHLDHEAIPKTVVEGTVRDDVGFMVEGARVMLTADGQTWETRTIEGVFQFYLDLSADTMGELAATGTGYGWNNLTTTIMNRDANQIDLTLPLDAGSSNVVGTVSTDTLKPVEGAEVHLQYLGAYHQAITTGADGSFAFRLVPSQDQPYSLSVLAEGFDGVTVEAMAESGRTSRYYLTLHEDVTSVETVAGRVLNRHGYPIASASVGIGDDHVVTTEANGTFVLVAEDLEGWLAISASSPGFETVHRAIDVKPGATVEIELVLSVSDSRASTVQGVVKRSSDGKPIEGAVVTLGWSGADTWTFETTADPNGGFSFDLVPRAWGSVTITVTVEGYYQEAAHAILSDTEPTWIDFIMQRVEVAEPEEPMITQQEARNVGVGVGVSLAVIAAIMLTEVGKVAILGLLLVPLYTKIKREKVMDHFIRGRIYEFICNNPGVNYSAIKSQFKLTNGTVTYHLSMLERQEFIRAKQDGIYKRYFANNGGPAVSEVEPMSLQLSIAKAVRDQPGMTQKELAKRLGSSKQLVSYHIRNMRNDGLLDTRRDGRSVRIYPNPRTPE